MFVHLKKVLTYTLTPIKLITSKLTILRDTLTIAILRLLPNPAVPLAASLAIKPLGLVILILALPLVWKFWPGETPQLETTPSVEPTIETPPLEVLPQEEPPSVEEEPTPKGVPVDPKNQGWSTTRWILTITGVGIGLLLGSVVIWYFWPSTLGNSDSDYRIELTRVIAKELYEKAVLLNYAAGKLRPYIDAMNALVSLDGPWTPEQKVAVRLAEEAVYKCLVAYLPDDKTIKVSDIVNLLNDVGFSGNSNESAEHWLARMRQDHPYTRFHNVK